MITNINRFIGWCFVCFLLAVSIYCESEMLGSWDNAFLNVVVTFVVFYIGYSEANSKCESLKNQIQDLQKQLKQLEDKQA